jgi:hypothetical protein
MGTVIPVSEHHTMKTCKSVEVNGHLHTLYSLANFSPREKPLVPIKVILDVGLKKKSLMAFEPQPSSSQLVHLQTEVSWLTFFA